mgnify:CR=1 FL=1
MSNIETYAVHDTILSMLLLPNPCEIRIDITEKYVYLHIGPRDWQWDRKTGAFIGCGTALLATKKEQAKAQLEEEEGT